jgi:hypothetical protein
MDEETASFAANAPGDGPPWPAVFHPGVPDATAAHVTAACAELFRPGVEQVADEAMRSMLHDLGNRGVEAEYALFDWMVEAWVGQTSHHFLRVYRPLWQAQERVIAATIAAAREMHLVAVRHPSDAPNSPVFEVGLASDRDAREADTWVRYKMSGHELIRSGVFECPESGTRADVPFFHPGLADDAARHVANEYSRVIGVRDSRPPGVAEIIVAMAEDLKRRGLSPA